MPRTASAFAESLEKSLTPLMAKPPMKPATVSMQELVACYCTVIRVHTHNFQLLVKILRACMVRLKQVETKAVANANVKLDHASAQVMSLTTLLCEHGNFDAIRESSEDLKTEIDKVSKGSIVDHICESILALYHAPNKTFRAPSLQCLGFVFRSYPSLMIGEVIAQIMDDVFKSGSATDRELLLKIILDSLSSNQHSLPDEPSSSSPRKKDVAVEKVDMDELVGNTDRFADSG